MKRLFACLLALTLCAGLMSIPAMAAESDQSTAKETTEEPARLGPVRVWGSITRMENGSLMVENSNEEDPYNQIIVHLSESTYVVDAVSGSPVKADSLKDGDTVYAWVGPAMALSLPSQATATVVVTNIPADYAAPQYYQVAEVKPQAVIDIHPVPPLTNVDLITTSGEELTITDEAQLTPYLTKNMVYLESIQPGTELLVWKDAQGTVTKAMFFPYQYRGYLTMEDGTAAINGQVLEEAAKVTEEETLLPIRAVAEILGMDVSWDAEKGAVVSYGKEMTKPEGQDSNVLFTAMPGGEIWGMDEEGKPVETYGTCVKENGVTYLSSHTLANLLDLFVAG